MAELSRLREGQPGKLTYASSGNGSLQHVTGAMLEQQAGIQMTHIPYKGTGPALQDLLGAQVDVTFGTPPPVHAAHPVGQAARARGHGQGAPGEPADVPTAAEAGLPKLDATSWFAVFAPANTPKPVVDKLSAEIAKVMATPRLQAEGRRAGRHRRLHEPAAAGRLHQGRAGALGAGREDVEDRGGLKRHFVANPAGAGLQHRAIQRGALLMNSQPGVMFGLSIPRPDPSRAVRTIERARRFDEALR
jgi:hypothetical protein